MLVSVAQEIFDFQKFLKVSNDWSACFFKIINLKLPNFLIIYLENSLCISFSYVFAGATEDDNEEEPIMDGAADPNQVPVEEDELRQPFLQRQQLMKTARRYRTRKSQKFSASLTASQTQSLNASLSISHRLQTVNREYQKQNTLTRSRSNTATSVNEDVNAAETKVPYHTIIIDCAPITFVDSMGTRALYQVIACMYCIRELIFIFTYDVFI